MFQPFALVRIVCLEFYSRQAVFCVFLQVLTNVSASTMKKRIQEMLSVGYQQPLPVKVLAASRARFVVMLEKFAKGCSQHHEEASKREFLEKVSKHLKLFLDF